MPTRGGKRNKTQKTNWMFPIGLFFFAHVVHVLRGVFVVLVAQNYRVDAVARTVFDHNKFKVNDFVLHPA